MSDITLTYDSFDARIFGERGFPDNQGWTYVEDEGGKVIDTVFGVEKEVIHFRTTGGETEAEFPLSASDWVYILMRGTSFSSTLKSTEDIGNNPCVCVISFAGENDPRPSPSKSRFIVFIKNDGNYTTITFQSGTAIVLNGSNGNPNVPIDTWFTFEVKVHPTPDSGTNFGAGELYINGVLISTKNIVNHSSAVVDVVRIGRGASSGTADFSVDNFGVTIYKEPPTKLLTATDMEADGIGIIYPSGRRDYETIIPDNNPRAIGARIEIVAKNVGGTINFRTENLNAPKVLFNGVNSYVLDIPEVKKVDFINTVDQANNYQSPMEARNLSRLNFYTPLNNPYETPDLVANTPTKVFIEQSIVKTAKDFTVDAVNDRWFLSDPTALNRWFIVHVSDSITVNVQNQIVAIEVYVNGVFVEGAGASRRMQGITDEGNLDLVGVLQLSYLDYIEGYVTLSTAGKIKFERFALTLNEIVGAE